MLSYAPQKGDIIWINFDPQAGKEIQKRRPALVLSSTDFNKYSSFAFICPITSRIKDDPKEILIKYKDIDGVVLVDQLKSLDWTKRKAKLIGRCDIEALNKALKVIASILELNKIHR